MIDQDPSSRLDPSQPNQYRLINLPSQPSSPSRRISLCNIRNPGSDCRPFPKHGAERFSGQLSQTNFIRCFQILFEHRDDVQQQAGTMAVHCEKKVVGVGHSFDVIGLGTSAVCQLDLREVLSGVSWPMEMGILTHG